jgi:hypothetical protein
MGKEGDVHILKFYHPISFDFLALPIQLSHITLPFMQWPPRSPGHAVTYVVALGISYAVLSTAREALRPGPAKPERAHDK